MRGLAALGLALALGGCATDNDDHAFFNQGWLKPEEGADRRLYRSHAPLAPEEARKLDER